MIQLGKFQDLYIVKKKEFGVYVNDQKDVTDGSILLPAKQVPDGAGSVIRFHVLFIRTLRIAQLLPFIFQRSH